MNLTLETRTAVLEVGRAVRRPEELALRWRDRLLEPARAPTRTIFPILLATAVLGLAAYGLTMGLHRGPAEMISSSLRAPLAAGAAWTLALPALYVVGSALGSRLDLSTTALAALVTCSFGALAMLASVPINWFFTLAAPSPVVRVAVNLVVFAGVGVSMGDTFLRVMRALEPERKLLFPAVWLGLLATIGAELMLLLDLFQA